MTKCQKSDSNLDENLWLENKIKMCHPVTPTGNQQEERGTHNVPCQEDASEKEGLEESSFIQWEGKEKEIEKTKSGVNFQRENLKERQ